jgi:hypothetical protein
MNLYASKPGYTPLRDIPLVGKKLADIPQFGRVGINPDDPRTIRVIDEHTFYEVSYQANEKPPLTGWVYSGYLDVYTEEFPSGVVKINTGTPNPNDAAQYIVWNGQAQYMLCGELCILYCTGWDLEISEFLDALRSRKESRFKAFFTRIFPSLKSRGTGLEDLDIMLELYEGYEIPSRRLTEALYEPVYGRGIVSPGRYAEALKTHQIIIGCKIDTITGRLRGQGAPHWVVLEQMTPDRAGQGWALIYNPFTNSMERYSYDEFMKSVGNPSGILVERTE